MLVLAGTVAGGCCAAGGGPGQAAAVAKQELNDADLERLQRLLVDERGQPVPDADIHLISSESRGAVRAALEAAARHPGSERVTVRYGLANGSAVVLVKQAGGYRVRFAPLPRDCPTTAVDALQAFRAAIVSQGEHVSIGTLTTRLRTQIEGESRAVLDGLANIEELEVSESASTAHVTLPSGHIIVLRMEEGCWRIDEVD